MEGIEYQKFEINENDITYNDLLKYIHLPKHSVYNELKSYESDWIGDVCIKTIVIYISYNSGKIRNIYNKINCEFTIKFSYKYYIYSDYDGDGDGDGDYKRLKNNIKNCSNISDVVKNDPYQIIFIDSDYENYEEICKLAILQNYKVLKYIEEQTDEICKLAVQQNGCALYYVIKQTDEICKLALINNPNALHYVKEEFKTPELLKLINH